MASLMANLLLLLTFVTLYNNTFGYSWSGLGRLSSYDLEQDSNDSNSLKSYLNKFCDFPKSDDILQQIQAKLSQDPSDENPSERIKTELTTALQLRSNILRVLNHLLSYTNFTEKHKNEIQALELLIKGITNREFFVGKLVPLASILDRAEQGRNLKIIFGFLGDILPGVYKSATDILEDFVEKEQDDSHLKEVVPFIFHKIKPNYNLTPKYIEMDTYLKPLLKSGSVSLDSDLVERIFLSYPYFSNMMQIQEYLADLSSLLKKTPQVTVHLKDDLTTKELLNKISDQVFPENSRRSLGGDDLQGIPESKKEQTNLIDKIFKNLAKYEIPPDIAKGLDALFNKKRQLLSVLPHMNHHHNVLETIAELLSIIVRVSEDNPKVPKKILPLAKSLYQNIKFKFLYHEGNYKDLDKVTIPKILDLYGHIPDEDFQRSVHSLKAELSRYNLPAITVKFGADPKKILKDYLVETLQENPSGELSEKILPVLNSLDKSGDYISRVEGVQDEVEPTEEPKRRADQTTKKGEDIVYVQNSYEDYGDKDLPRRQHYYQRSAGGRPGIATAIQETATPTPEAQRRTEMEEAYPGMDQSFKNHQEAISNLSDLKKQLERFFNPARRNLDESTEGTTQGGILRRLKKLFPTERPKKKDSKPTSRIEEEDDDKLKPAEALKNLLSNSGFSQRDVVNLYNGIYDLQNREAEPKSDPMPFNDFLTSLYEKSKDHDLSPFKHSLKKGVVPETLMKILNGSRRGSEDGDLHDYYPNTRHFDPINDVSEKDLEDALRRSGSKPDQALLNTLRKMIAPRSLDQFYSKLKHPVEGRDPQFEKALFDFVAQQMVINPDGSRRNLNEKSAQGFPNPLGPGKRMQSPFGDPLGPGKRMETPQAPAGHKYMPLEDFLQMFSRRALPTKRKADPDEIKDLDSLTRFLNGLIEEGSRKKLNPSRKSVDIDGIINTFQKMLTDKDSTFRKDNPTFLKDVLSPQRRSGSPEPKTPEDKLKVILSTGVVSEKQMLGLFRRYKDLPENRSRRGFLSMIGGFAKWIWDTLNETINLPKLALTAGTHLLNKAFGSSSRRSGVREEEDTYIDDIVMPKAKFGPKVPVSGQRRSLLGEAPSRLLGEAPSGSRRGGVDPPLLKLSKFDPVPRLWRTLWECTFSTGPEEEVPYLGIQEYETYPDYEKTLMDLHEHQSFGSSQKSHQSGSSFSSTFESNLESRMEKLFQQMKSETLQSETSASKKGLEALLRTSEENKTIPVKEAASREDASKESASKEGASSFFSSKMSNLMKYTKDVIAPYLEDKTTDQTTDSTRTTKLDHTTFFTEAPDSTKKDINTERSARRFMKNDSFDLKSETTSRDMEGTTGLPQMTTDTKVRTSLDEESKKRQNSSTILEDNGKVKKVEITEGEKV